MPPYILTLVLIFANHTGQSLNGAFQDEEHCDLAKAKMVQRIDEYNATKEPKIVGYVLTCNKPEKAQQGIGS